MNDIATRQREREGQWFQQQLAANGFKVGHLPALEVLAAAELAKRARGVVEKQRLSLETLEQRGQLTARAALDALTAAQQAGNLNAQADNITGSGSSQLLSEPAVMPAHLLLTKVALAASGQVRANLRTSQSPEDASEMRIGVHVIVQVQDDYGRWRGPAEAELAPYFKMPVSEVLHALRDAAVDHYWKTHQMVNSILQLEPGTEFETPEAAFAALQGSGHARLAGAVEPEPGLRSH